MPCVICKPVACGLSSICTTVYLPYFAGSLDMKMHMSYTTTTSGVDTASKAMWSSLQVEQHCRDKLCWSNFRVAMRPHVQATGLRPYTNFLVSEQAANARCLLI